MAEGTTVATAQPNTDAEATEEVQDAQTTESTQEETKVEDAQSEEQKTEDVQKTEDSTDTEDSKEEVEGAPEEYSDFTVPEGVEIDTELLGSFKETAKEMNLTQDNAQKLVDMANTLSTQLVEKQQVEWTNVREQWKADLDTDKDFGGPKLNETQVRCQRTLAKFGNDNLIQFLDSTGYGDNPDIVRLLAKVDMALSEDKVVEGSVPSQSQNATMAQILYPNDK